MSYLGPMDEVNLKRLRNQISSLSPFATSPGTISILVETLIKEWEERGQRIEELETELAEAVEHIAGLLATIEEGKQDRIALAGEREALAAEVGLHRIDIHNAQKTIKELSRVNVEAISMAAQFVLALEACAQRISELAGTNLELRDKTFMLEDEIRRIRDDLVNHGWTVIQIAPDGLKATTTCPKRPDAPLEDY